MIASLPIVNNTPFPGFAEELLWRIVFATDKSWFKGDKLELEGPYDPTHYDWPYDIYYLNIYDGDLQRRLYVSCYNRDAGEEWYLYKTLDEMQRGELHEDRSAKISDGSIGSVDDYKYEYHGWWWIKTLGWWWDDEKKEIIVLDGVTEIREDDLCDFAEDEEIRVPDGIVSIGENAFKGYAAKRIIIPDTVTTIEVNAFYECAQLEHINIPNHIDFHDFDGCASLKEIKIPFAVKELTYGLCGLKSLERLILHRDIQKIAPNLFDLFTHKVTIEIDPANPYYTTQDGCVYDRDITTLYYAMKPLVVDNLPKSVKRLSSAITSSDINLDQLDLSMLLDIQDGILKYAHPGIRHISLPDEISEITAHFGSNLEAITLPQQLKYLGDGVFCRCKKLEQLILPHGLEIIGDYALPTGLTGITIPASVILVGTLAFSGSEKLVSVTIKAHSLTIGKSAFAHCSSLKQLLIEGSVDTIEDKAFSFCSGLTSVRFPEGLRSIGNSAFENCKSLEEVNLPNSIQKIGVTAFAGCVNIRIIRIENPIPPECISSACYPFPVELWETCTLQVPKQAIETYKEHPFFGRYRDIQTI